MFDVFDLKNADQTAGKIREGNAMGLSPFHLQHVKVDHHFQQMSLTW